MSDTPAVVFEHVDFAYDGEPVLSDVSFSIRRQEFVTVVGPNGGGKTSLLRLVLGMLRPTRGTVRVFGAPPERQRGRMGYVPQFTRFDPLFPMTVADVVQMGRLGRYWTGPYRREDREAVRSALGQVGLEALRGRAFAGLSGGQRQRILIARALATDPQLLLLDEPTANVDRLATEQLYELLVRLNRGLTVVLVSHDLGVVSRFASNVLCVNRTVYAHPIAELTGEMISKLYGANTALVRHDHLSGEES